MTAAPEIGNVLIVDDDPRNIRRIERAIAPSPTSDTISAENGEQALERLAANGGPHGFFGVVVTDLKMPVMDGLELLQRVQGVDRDLPVIIITAYGDIASAVQAMKGGAHDFIERPFDAEILRARVNRALEKRRLVIENRTLKSELAGGQGLAARLIGNSPEIRTLRDDIARIAATDATVLIFGETGTGKEVAARGLHDFSERKNARFVAVNCGALPENLIDSELFGHEAGAFTDAKKRRIGLCEYADGGTLFLDEIESMPLGLQVKLLRLLQERKISRLGSNEEIEVDLRVVAATKTDLREAAERGEFREDLYYRLSVAELTICPLNERRDDIPLLFEHFVNELAIQHRRDAAKPSPSEFQALMVHDWRGNVRELRNAAERFVLNLGGPADQSPPTAAASGQLQDLRQSLNDYESALINRALAENAGNTKAAAESLGIPRRTLSEKMRKHGLRRADFA